MIGWQFLQAQHERVTIRGSGACRPVTSSLPIDRGPIERCAVANCSVYCGSIDSCAVASCSISFSLIELA